MSQDLPDDAPATAGGPASDGEETLDELRRILLGDQRDKVERLEHRLDDRHEQARAVSDVLPEAVRMRGEHDEKLRRAMAPNIEEVIRESVKRRPRVLADALFPVMGPAIRRSILDTLQKFVQSLNQALEHSLSPQSFRWRLEAWRTGRPFAEVVLVHTLLYRVEQVFLIHRETGLLLQHAAIPAVEADDGDMVSGMLTAIQDFARDSFHVEEDEGLSAAKVGELTVWMEPGPQAGVAVVIRGTPPQELREKLAEAVEEIHALESEALADFDGDATPFAGTRELLEALLIEQGQERTKRKNRNRLAAGFLVAVAAAVGIWIFFDVRDRLRWRDFLSRLEAEPGVVVTAEDRGERDVRGLRDAMAVEPLAVFREVYGDDGELAARFGAFDSHDAPIVLRRARARLGLPEDVRFELEKGTLRATGRATSAAIEAAAAEAPRLPGVSAVDFRGLERTDADAWRARRRAEEILAALPGVVVLRRSPAEIELLVDSAGERALDDALRDEDGGSLTERGGFTLRLRRTRSLDAAAAELRLRDAHPLPVGASLRVDDAGRVILRGIVTEEQLEALRDEVARDPALSGLDESGAGIVEAELRRAWAEYVARLRGTPGIVLLETGDGITDFRVRGLRDPLSPFAALAAPDPRLDDRIELDLAPFDSPEPTLALARFDNALAPPSSVRSRLQNGVLHLSGRAPRPGRNPRAARPRSSPGSAPSMRTDSRSSARSAPSRPPGRNWSRDCAPSPATAWTSRGVKTIGSRSRGGATSSPVRPPSCAPRWGWRPPRPASTSAPTSRRIR
ncbi:MAG: hypothetical protein R3F20_19225 [Planctomycetota bacterium]